jgi:Lipid A 3-O-deacylase (PagL)
VYASKRSVLLGLAPLLCALSAFPQSDAVSFNRANPRGERTIDLVSESLFNEKLIRETAILTEPTLPPPDPAAASEPSPQPDLSPDESPATLGNMPEEDSEDSKDSVTFEKLEPPKRADFNREIYYRNKLEFSLDAGWLPINVPFPLDVFVGDTYNMYPLKYTLAPIFASLRWHINGVGGPLILRGNWDLTCTGSITAVPRGPENRYFSYIMGIRRNFVPRNWKAAPYFDIRLGLGHIDAKGPQGVPYAQGEDFTFTVNMGSGVRYNLSPRYAISAGLNFMHISNLNLSQGNGKPDWGIRNYGINVYGPMVGLDIQLRKHARHSE